MTTSTAKRPILSFNIVSGEEGRESVSVFVHGGEQLTATKTHPNFNHICEVLVQAKEAKRPLDEDEIRGLFDVNLAISNKFVRLSERVSAKDGKIYFDNDPVDNALTKTILRFHAEGEQDFMPLVNFMEKIAANPQQHSRDQLFRWLGKHHFAIHPDGDFIAYKGVNHATGRDPEDYLSRNSGKAIVNGVVVNGRIPNKPGTIIEMPRSEVVHDPRNGCSTGLHVANWKFAKSFTHGPVLRVKVNPRDVVSVPTDSNDEKMRVCRYRVIDRVEAEDKELLYFDPDKTLRVAPEETRAATVPDREPSTQRPFVRSRGAAKKVAKKAVAKKAKAAAKKAAAPKMPRYYEQFKKEHFDQLPMSEIRWIATQWEVSQDGTRDQITERLVKNAEEALAKW